MKHSLLEISTDPQLRTGQLLALAVEMADGVFSEQPTDVSILSGGVTNQLYKVSNRLGEAVVVRVFGQETERFISRDAELFWQSQFLRTFGRAKNALVYEFLTGFRNLDTAEMKEMWELCAKALANFHVAATKTALIVLPYATEPNFTNVVLQEWFSIALSDDCQGRIAAASEVKKRHLESLDLPTYAKEAEALRTKLQENAHLLPEGICHNDLLGANIMLRRDETAAGSQQLANVRLIDFEYCHRNFLYYDLANHFNEYGGLEADWSKYPNDAAIASFVDAYLDEARRLTAPATGADTASVHRGTEVVRLIKLLSQASHLKWAAWSVIQCAFSAIDFDYLTYAGQRLEGYRLLKVS